jgi:hypothetical protein
MPAAAAFEPVATPARGARPGAGVEREGCDPVDANGAGQAVDATVPPAVPLLLAVRRCWSCSSRARRAAMAASASVSAVTATVLIGISGVGTRTAFGSIRPA